jgi:flagellar biosynthetic protein FliR
MEQTIIREMAAALFIGTRISGMVLFAPFFGHTAIPPRLKALLVIVLTIALFPLLESRFDAASISAWPVVVATELVVGIGMGMAANLVFDAIEFAGHIASLQTGLSLINVLDPQTQVDTTVVSLFQHTIAFLIFLRLDVHHWIVRAIAKSFQYLPPGKAIITPGFAHAAIAIVASAFVVGLQIAAPVLIATVIVDFTLAFMAKASSQTQVMLLGIAVKVLVGLLVLAATLRYWPSLMERYFTESIAYSERVLRLAR